MKNDKPLFKIDSVIESLLILRLLNNMINEFLKSLVDDTKPNIDSNSALYFGIKSYILIFTNSFLDEWDGFLISKEDNHNKQILINAKKKAKPAIDRIRKWDGLKECRNTMLAHNFRNKKQDNRSVFLINNMSNLLVPDHISEIILLSWCINKSTQIVCEPFIEELQGTKDEYFKLSTNTVRIIDFNNEIMKIASDINNIKD